MAAEDLATGYARAIVAVATAENALDRVADELFRFARAVSGHPQLRDRLGDPTVAVTAKQQAAADLLSAAHPQTVTAVALILQAGRARLLGEIAEAVGELSAERRGAALAEVRTAKPLSADRQQRLAEALRAATGQKVELQIVTDADLLGGVVVRVGDTVIDGSVAKRLADLRGRLTTA